MIFHYVLWCGLPTTWHFRLYSHLRPWAFDKANEHFINMFNLYFLHFTTMAIWISGGLGGDFFCCCCCLVYASLWSFVFFITILWRTLCSFCLPILANINLFGNTQLPNFPSIVMISCRWRGRQLCACLTIKTCPFLYHHKNGCIMSLLYRSGKEIYKNVYYYSRLLLKWLARKGRKGNFVLFMHNKSGVNCFPIS